MDRARAGLRPAHRGQWGGQDQPARGRFIAGPGPWVAWRRALEEAMAGHGTAIAGARARTVAALDERIGREPEDEFARSEIGLEGWEPGDLAATLRANRGRDTAAGRTTEGPHRQDLAV